MVTLTVSDQHCTETDTASIFIYDLPVAYAGEDTTICPNGTVQIGTSNVAGVITSYSIHYTKLYDETASSLAKLDNSNSKSSNSRILALKRFDPSPIFHPKGPSFH